MKTNLQTLRAASLAAALLLSTGAFAATTTWTNRTTSGFWSVPGSWNPNGVPVSDPATTVDFFTGSPSLGNITINTTNDVAAPFQLNNLTLGGSAPGAGSAANATVALYGSPLQFVLNGATVPTLNCTSTRPTGGSNLTYVVGSDLQLSADLNLQASGIAGVQLQGVISDDGLGRVITKSGSSDVQFFGANTFYGPVVIAGGRLYSRNNTAFGDPSSPTILLPGSGGIYFTSAQTNAEPFIVGSNLRAGGSVSSTLTGSITVTNNGTIQADGNARFIINGDITSVNDSSLNVSLGGTGNPTIFAGAVNLGAGRLLKSSTATLRLDSANNTWSGGLSIATGGGTVQIGNSNSASMGTGTITNNGTLSFNFINTLVVNDPIYGTGSVAKAGSGTLVLGGNSSFTGNVTVPATASVDCGVIRVTSSTGLGVGLKTVTQPVNQSTGYGTLELMDNVNISSTINLDVSGHGTPTRPHLNNVSGNNTWGGAYRITGTGGGYYIRSDSGTLTLAGLLTNTLGSVRNINFSGAGDGVISGPLGQTSVANALGLSFDGTGTWTFNSASLHSGITAVTTAGGRLVLGATAAITNSSSVSLVSGATLDVSAVTAGFTLSAAKAQTLSGSGVVVGNVATATGSLIYPGGAGTVGTLSFSNNLTLSAATTNYFDLTTATTVGGGVNDLVNVAGNLDPNGAVIVIADRGALTVPGHYRLFSYGGTKPTSFNPTVISADSRYTFTLDETILGQVNLIVSGGGSNLLWSGGTAGLWDYNSSASWNNNTAKFFQGDVVSFDDTTTSNIVSVTGTLYPASVTVNGSSNYTFQAGGKISGSTGITKNGNGTLFLANTNGNDFIGAVNVNGGKVIAGSTTAFGATNGATILAPGATLDVNNKNLGAEPIIAAGSGVGGAGAIVNSGAEQQQATRYVTLAGDTTFGGINRWDVRKPSDTDTLGASLQGNGYALTKTGSNYVALVRLGETSLGDITLNGGTLEFAYTTTMGDPTKTLTVNTGAVVSLWNTIANIPVKNLALNAGQVTCNAGANGFAGPMALAGTNVLSVGSGASLDLHAPISGTGGLTKSGAGTLNLLTNETYSGATLVVGGQVALGLDASLSNTPSITLSNGTTLDVSALASGLTLQAGQTLAGNGTVNGAVTAPDGSRLVPGMSPGTLTFNSPLTLNNAAGTFELGATTTGPNDQILAAAGLAASGVTTINIIPLATLDTVNPYTLFVNNGTPLPSGSEANFSVVSDSRYEFVVEPTDQSGGSKVNVFVTGSGSPATLTWRGNNALNPTYWDNKTTTNWLNGAFGEKFFAGDTTVFDDTAIGTTAALVGTLQPAQVVLSNSLKAITLTGSGSLSAGSLTNDSTGLTTIGNAAGNLFNYGLTLNSGTLIFTNAGANNFGSGVTIHGGVLDIANPAVNTFGALTLYGGNVNILNGFANNLGSATFMGPGTLTFDQPANLTMAYSLGGPGTVVKAGTNALTLSANNSGFSGPIQVTAGTLRAGNVAALGDTVGITSVANGASLDVNGLNLGNEPVTASGAGVNGLGAIVNNSATAQNNALHDITLAGDTTFGGVSRWDLRTNASGPATLSTGGNGYHLTKIGGNQVGVVSATVDSALGNIDVLQGTFSYEGSSTSLGDPAKTLTIASNAVFQFWATVVPLNKLVALKAGSRVVVGSGTANAIAGKVTLERGTNVLDVATNCTLTVNNEISGEGLLRKITAGTLGLASSNSFSGGSAIEAGFVVASDSSSFGVGAVTLSGASIPSRIQLGNGVNETNALTLNANVGTSGRGLLEATGTGSATWSGPITVTAGPSAGGHFYSDSGALLTVAGPITAPSGFSQRAGNVAYSGGGAYTGFTLTGLAKLGANNGLATTVTPSIGASGAAVLDLAGFDQTLAGLSKSANAATVTNSSSTRSTLTIGSDTDNTYSGLLAGNLTLVKVHTNILTLNGANNYSGETVIKAGSLLVQGAQSGTGAVTVQSGGTLGGNGSLLSPVSVEAGGTLAPGVALGTLTINNTVTLGGTNRMEVTKTGSLFTNALLRGVSTLTYGGTLDLVLSGTTLAAGDTIKLFDATNYVGAFTAIVPSSPGAGLAWDTSALTTTGTLGVMVAAAPAISGVNLLPDGNISLTLNGVIGQPYSVRVSPDVVLPVSLWTVLYSGTISSVPSAYIDLTATNYPQRFYLISSP